MRESWSKRSPASPHPNLAPLRRLYTTSESNQQAPRRSGLLLGLKDLRAVLRDRGLMLHLFVWAWLGLDLDLGPRLVVDLRTIAGGASFLVASLAGSPQGLLALLPLVSGLKALMWHGK